MNNYLLLRTHVPTLYRAPDKKKEQKSMYQISKRKHVVAPH